MELHETEVRIARPDGDGWSIEHFEQEVNRHLSPDAVPVRRLLAAGAVGLLRRRRRG